MKRRDLLEAVKFNFECYVRGFIEYGDFLQAIEEEINKI